MITGLIVSGCENSSDPVTPEPSTLGRAAKANPERTDEWVPFEYTIDNPCGDGQIHLVGKYHFSWHSTLADNGVYNYTTHVNKKATGQEVGGEGKWQLSAAVGNEHYQFSGKSGEVFHLTTLYRLVGLGAEPIFAKYLRTHYTINANGDLTVEINEGGAHCVYFQPHDVVDAL